MRNELKKIMKLTAFLAVFAAVLLQLGGCAALAGAGGSGTTGEYLRVHIRANSNSDDDQNVKYAVKSAVVEYLTPYLAGSETKSAAMTVIERHLSGIEAAANAVVKAAGFSYSARASLRRESFPARNYGDLTLESGVYDALIVLLGTGSGDNWWCVVYPPLCFVGAENNGTNAVRYRSKLLEIINKFKKK